MLELFPSPQVIDGFDAAMEYSDGESEERLLALFSQGDEQTLSQQVQRMLRSDLPWSELVHLSPQRHHLLDWYPFRSDSLLLELGAGCGALTGLLCDRVAQVEAVDLSMRRAQILLRRHRNRANLRVLVGDLASLCARQPQYDYVTAIGVFEYAGRYVHTDRDDQPFAAYLQFLRDIYTILAPGGTLLLAIENQLGAKYLAGGAEDHYVEPLVGVEDYRDDAGIRTFGKVELQRLIEQAGLHVVQMYYPVPDYKMPTTIYSDALPPGSTEHISLLYPTPDPSHPHGYYFDEGRFMHMAARNELATVFANSFLVECQR